MKREKKTDARKESFTVSTVTEKKEEIEDKLCTIESLVRIAKARALFSNTTGVEHISQSEALVDIECALGIALTHLREVVNIVDLEM